MAAMKKISLLALALPAVLLASCTQERRGPETLPPPPPPQPSAKKLTGQDIAVQEWRAATDRAGCAPLGLTSDLDAGGVPRPADFSSGWGVGFDLPDMRSAYGFAGPGRLNSDNASVDEKRKGLQNQWPYFRELSGPPAPAFAGYGIEGAEAYPSDHADGVGSNSLAYVHIGGQTCNYNVWSKLGRKHLEGLLDNLRVIDPADR